MMKHLAQQYSILKFNPEWKHFQHGIVHNEVTLRCIHITRNMELTYTVEPRFTNLIVPGGRLSPEMSANQNYFILFNNI
jgi:hypothetical protein